MKFSIITVNYNNRQGLEKTIQSVLGQTFQDYQYIIIDGGSSDGSVDVIKRYADRIDYWVSEPDKGVYNAMNKGIQQAKGEYLNFMNSGDSFHSSSVLNDMAKMEFTEEIITGGFYDKEKNKYFIIAPQEVTLLTMLKETFNHQATFFKKALFNNRQYDESYTLISDYKFNLLSIIFDKCSIRIINYIVADYDFNGLSSNKPRVMKEKERLFNELIPQRIMKDYETMYTPEEIPIIKLFPELRESPRIQSFVYRFASFLIKCKHLIK